MALDVALVRVLKHRERYDRLYRTIPEGIIDPLTKVILDDYGRWFRQHMDQDVVDIDAFRTYFKLSHPKTKPEKMTLVDKQLANAAKPCDPEVEAGLHDRLCEAAAALKTAQLLEKYEEGADISLTAALRTIQEELESQLLRKVKMPWVDVQIEELLDEDENDSGLHWRLDCLNDAMRPLRPGDFGIVAARPDAGKTTFLTSELTFMASQMEEGRGIAWFNNEGPGRRIVGRIWQSALDQTVPELREMREAGTLRQAYAAEVGGADRVKVYDVHDWYSQDIEDIIKRTRPGLVVLDMVDNIRFGGLGAHEGSRTDQILEAMYQWARILGVKYDCPILATSQVSGDGAGMSYPLQGMLKDSKTGKQGAADFILMVGKNDDPLLSQSRFLSLPKCKLNRPGTAPLRCEVVFDGDRGRYRMPE